MHIVIRKGGTIINQRLKEIVDNLEAIKIGLDEPFKFGCTMCGKCCIHREDILLSPKDIYNMSKELQISPADMVEQYCENYIGEDSRVPIIRLLPRGTVRRCPLLKNRKCMVHKAKPTVCAMFPIGRCLVADNPEEGLKEISQDQVQYIFMNPGCGDKSETHTVREYLESFDISVEDEFFLKWQQVVLKMGDIFRKIEKRVKPEIMQQVWTIALVGLYLHYETDEDFMTQFDANAKTFFRMLQALFAEGGEDGSDPVD